MKKHYCERDLLEMDRAGNHYGNHVMALTAEQLHSKSDIAAELGWRDMQIAELKAQRDALAAENAALKSAISYVCDTDNLPDYQYDGMGCGIEDRGIVDRYEAARYGWDEAIERIYSEVISFAEETETPATAAYLNSVRAEGIHLVKAKTAQAKDRLSQLADYEDYEPYLLGLDDACDQVIKELLDGTLPEKFAAQLRAGEPS